jgi:hypothetical protein
MKTTLAVSVLMSLCAWGAGTTSPGPRLVSRADAKQLKPGMSLDQVQQLLGPADVLELPILWYPTSARGRIAVFGWDPLAIGPTQGVTSVAECPADTKVPCRYLVPAEKEGQLFPLLRTELVIARAANAPVRSLLKPLAPKAKATVALSGTVKDYVEAVAASNGLGKVTRTDLTRCENGGGACVEIVGHGCPAEAGDACRGTDLTLVVDVSREKPVLDSARGPEGPVKDQADVEVQLKSDP